MDAAVAAATGDDWQPGGELSGNGVLPAHWLAHRGHIARQLVVLSRSLCRRRERLVRTAVAEESRGSRWGCHRWPTTAGAPVVLATPRRRRPNYRTRPPGSRSVGRRSTRFERDG